MLASRRIIPGLKVMANRPWLRQSGRSINTVQSQLTKEVLENQTVAYTWGLGNNGQLGFEFVERNTFDKPYVEPVPRRMLKSKQYASFAMNDMQTIAVTKSGELYGSGVVEKGFLSPGSDLLWHSPSKEFTPLPFDAHVVQASMGPNHGAVVDKDGLVYTWGQNGGFFGSAGYLAQGDTTNYKKPKLVKFMKDYSKVAQVGCGAVHTVFLTVDGEVLCAGSGEYGRLGNGSTGEALIPQLVEALEDVVQIAVAADHTLALTKDGDVYGWGKNQVGQLGQADSFSDPHSMEIAPRLIEVYPTNEDGEEDHSKGKVKFSYIHAGTMGSLGITRTGELYTWGLKTSNKPRLIESSYFNGEKITKAVVVGGHGGYAVICLTASGHLYSFGKVQSHALGKESAQIKKISGGVEATPLLIAFKHPTHALDIFGAAGHHVAAIVKAPTDA